MRTSEKKSWQRILAFVLCMAMILSFVPATAVAVDGAENVTAVQVSSPAIEFVPATEPLRQEGRYLLMSDAYGHIMSFDATAAPEIASGEQHGTSYTGSIKLNAEGDSMNTYYMDGDTVILENSDRHFALWNLRQYKEATGGTTRHNGAFLAASANTTFGGTAQYAGVELQKRTSDHDSYWYSKYFDDTAVSGNDYQLRYFCFKSDSTAFKNHYRNSLQTTNNDVYGDQSGSRVKFILDSLGDDTYLLYFQESSTDYRVVTCNQSGRWDVIRYQGSDAVSRMKADLDKLKLRLYEYTETEGHKSAAFSGQATYQVAQNTAMDSILTGISSGITVFDPTHRDQHIPYDGSEVTVTNIGGTQYPVGTKAGYYWLDGSAVNTATPGEYPVLVKYRNDDGTDTTIGQVSVIVGSGYISGSTKSGTVLKNADVSTPVKVNSGDESAPATFLLNGETVTITVGMLTDADGNRLDTSEPGEYTGLTLTYKGMTICEDFTLTVSSGDHAMNYPEYDRPGSVKVYKDGTTPEEDFAETGVANIELSATAEPLEKGIDLIFIVDLSSSMRYHVNNSQYACGPKYNTDGSPNENIAKENGQDDLQYAYSENYWKNTRMYALEESLKSMVSTLSSSNTDVRIAIADFGDLDHYEFENAKLDATIGTPAGSKPYWDADLNASGGLGYEFSNHVNFILGRDDTSYTGTGAYMSQPYWVDQTKHNTGYELNTNGAIRKYTGKQLPKIYTGSGKLNSDAFQNANELNMKQIIEDMRIMNGKRLGTNYDVGLETAYRLAYAREQHNIAVGEERNIVCIFMSDGAAMQFNYLSGRSQTEAWSQCIIGETDEILEEQNVADKYVITSDPYDETVNQNPYLQAMLKDLLGILKEGNLIIPTKEDVKSTYPKLEAHMYNGTDFFQAMKAVGVDCDWELLWQIAYELYTHHNRGLTLADGSPLYYHNAVATGKNVVEAVTMSMRKPSYDASGNQYKYQTLSPYYYFYNAEGKNWWAEALKGDNHKLYPVISKFAFRDSTEWGEDVDFYYGDVRNNFSGETTEGLALDGQDYIAGFRGLDLDLYTIGFSLGTENRISYEETAQVLEHLASGPAYHYEAASGESLIEVLKSISSTISTSATRSFFTDMMGDDYDLSTERYVSDAEGNQVLVNAAPTIRVLEYTLDQSKPVYDTDGSLIRYERGVGTVRETITFEDLDGDGDTDAWSDQVYTIVTDNSGNQVKQYADIWDEKTGLITGKFVIYNTNKFVDEQNDGSVELYLDNSGRKFILEAETFFWTIGMIGETEMVLEYQTYLTGSVEGILRSDGVKKYYDTNEKAELTYVNYLGNSCTQSVDSPRYPWTTDFDGGLVNDKYVEATDDPNEFVLTLEAFAAGKVTSTEITKPADIVLVLDHSGSMRTPTGAPEVLESGTLYTGGGAIDRSRISTEKGEHIGYYVCQSTSSKAWFVMRFDRAENKWYGYSVPTTESIVDIRYKDAEDAKAKGGYTEHTMTQSWVAGTVPAQLVFYKSQYAVLYDALLEFVGDLRSSGTDHNVSIIGFAGSQGQGSRLYVGGDEDMVKSYNAMYNLADETRRTTLYQKAPKNVQNDAEYAELLKAIETIETNHSFTCPSAGLQMASDLFQANAVNMAERDRIVVLFTDGIPNRKLGEDTITEAEDKRPGRQAEIYDEIVKKACETKNTHGAQVYSICTTTLAAGENGENRTFLNYASSNYPNAAGYETPGTAASNKYFHESSDFDSLNNIFSTITQTISTTNVTLDGNTILKEVLTDYFELNPDDQVDVQVYTAKRKADGTFDAPVPAEGVRVELLPAGSARKDTIEVTGFDYAGEYVSNVPRIVNGKNYYGSKLIVKVRIRTRDGFWGGNNVPTNEPTTGIYDKNRVFVEDFPEPQVNVPIHVDVVTKDKTVYYGDRIDTDMDGWEGDELLQQITVGTKTDGNGNVVNGSTVTVNTVTNPDGSTTTTFIPQESWMDDFASMDWGKNSTTLGSDVSGTDPEDYTYTVVVTPDSDGSRNDGTQPGTEDNIAGSPTTGNSDSDTGHVFVKVPEVTFEDSVTQFGAPVEGYDYAGENHVRTEWVFMEDKNTDSAPAPTTEAPELVLTYTPTLDSGMTQFAGDTRVEVTVSRKDQPGLDIQSVTGFGWQSCTHGEHGSCGAIGSHTGADQIHEFWIHTGISILPDTVVIDFGLPVDIDPLTNDLSGVKNLTKRLIGIGNDFKSSNSFTFGDAAIQTGNQLVRYTLHISNGMQMNREETFKYRGSYAIGSKSLTADSFITVIPATVIYYEDSFVNFSSWTKDGSWQKDEISGWSAVAGHEDIQATDRPGTGQIGSDLNNRYGYDGAYTDESGYSMASYHQFTADANHSGEASFTFTGTGFDVIALSGGTTGTILVNVYDGDDTTKLLSSRMVDTYYGYKYENGQWVPTEPADPESLYQVPVMKVDMKAYDKYYVVITVSYNQFFDHGQDNVDGDSYNFMLDAIRIYDQANDGENSQVIEDAYVADGEGWPSYIELRNILIGANTFDSLGKNDEVNGIVFIDGIRDLTDDSASGEDGGIFTDPSDDKTAIADYANFGPNNELYLAKGQGVSFKLNLDGQNVQNIHLALKSVGGTAKVRVYGVDQAGKKTYALGSAGAAADITTATDLYYDITALRSSEAIVIVSSGDAILSVTNIKMTHTGTTAAQGQSELEMMLQRFRVSRDTAALALAAVTPAVVNPFEDVREGDFYYDSVLWAVANGITQGVGPTRFAPGEACSRAQVVTFLWRAAGSPEPGVTEHPFTDVEADSFYYKAMLWAVEQGITTGVDATLFDPNGRCDRGQIVTFLWRAAGSPEPVVTEHPFTDVEDGSFYHKAVLWAIENGITTGVGTNSFGPALTCTRGQVVTFLYRAYTR